MDIQQNNYELIKFEDGEFSLDVNVSPKEDTVWLTQKQMTQLFDVDKSRVSRHISAILESKELPISVVAEKATTGSDGKTYLIKYYNLDMIISVGYRVNSKRGILFRKWATSILKQYMLHGYSINEKRCIECQENLVSLNNKVDYLLNQNKHVHSRLTYLEKVGNILSDKLFYENQIFDAYSYIKQLFLSATSSIILIDGYIDITVLDMLKDVKVPITIYTYPNAQISNQDIQRFSINHMIEVYRTSLIHDRFIILDSVIYSIGASIKDAGKKRFVMTKLQTISINDLLKNL